jgi:DNA (cytosine-5)-methyltransferase 1
MSVKLEKLKELAKIYIKLGDKIIIADAHEYLLKHFKEFDFIWSSPPCQSHSSFRQNICVRFRGTKPEYPDMKLYQEIVFLRHNFKGKWIVENVKPYYIPLITPSNCLGRHYYWTNIEHLATDKKLYKHNIRKWQIPDFEKEYQYNLSEYKIKNKRQVLRNCVEPKIGLHILNESIIDYQMDKRNKRQTPAGLGAGKKELCKVFRV